MKHYKNNDKIKKMKHLKLFESFVKYHFEQFKKSIKDEIDTYIFSITDEYQSTSEKDTSYIDGGYLFIEYRNIDISKKDVEDFLKKLNNLEYSIKKYEGEIDIFYYEQFIEKDDIIKYEWDSNSEKLSLIIKICFTI